jgi:hypothetical protein
MPPHHVTCWNAKTFSFLAQLLGLRLVATLQEPLRYVHYKSYLSNYIKPYKLSGGSSIRAKLFRLLAQSFSEASEKVVDAIIATSYQSHKRMLVGQTHLAIFQKNG